MRLLRFGWLRSVCVTAILVVLLAAPAAAQYGDEDEDTGPFREPGISYKTDAKPYVPWIAGTLIILACLLVAFKNPHRTHLD